MLVGAGAFWAALELAGQHLPPGYSAQQVVWTRYAAHLLLLLWMPGRRVAVWRTQRLGSQVACSLCMLGMPIGFVGGARFLSTQNVWAIFWVSPLLTLVLGALVLGEEARARTWAASALALVGAVLVYAERPVVFWPALLWPLGMAFSFSLYVVLVRSLRHESTESKLFYSAMGVFLALTPGMPSRFVTPDLLAAAGMVAIGLLGLGCLYLIDRGLEGGSVPLLAPMTFAAVPWSLGFEALLGGLPGRRALLGAVVVTVALATHLGQPDVR
jgi:drug/metabolite transporter (DMT)-like permease